jgi:low affinity Fe/Cu permease
VPSLMVFLIQNTQNRDAKETHLKLDELLRAVQGARLSFISLEHLSEDELARLEDEFTQLRRRRPD